MKSPIPGSCSDSCASLETALCRSLRTPLKSSPLLHASLLVLTVLASCSRSHRPVGLFIYKEDDLFIRSFTRDIQAVADGSLELAIHYGLNSQIIQNEQIESGLKDRSPLMIVNPVDRLSARTLIRKLRSEQVPVIFFNREPLPEDLEIWDGAWYVGARAEQSGRMQASLVMELFGSSPESLNRYDRNSDNRIQTIILKGEQGHQDAEIRTKTVLEAFRNNGYNVDVLATEVANWNRDEGYEHMDEILDVLEAPPELVLSNNDAMALGAISLMRQRGLFEDTNNNGRIDREDDGWVPVVGIDGVPEAVGHIRDGYLYGTVLNDSLGMARSIVLLAQALLSGEDPASTVPGVEDNRCIWVDYQTFRLD